MQRQKETAACRKLRPQTRISQLVAARVLVAMLALPPGVHDELYDGGVLLPLSVALVSPDSVGKLHDID